MNSKLAAVAYAVILSGLTTAAAADPADDMAAGLQKCGAMTDATSRLACYDALSKNAQQEAHAQPAPDASHPPTKEQEESWFGFDVANLFHSSPAQQTTPQQFGSENLPSTKAKEEAVETELESISAGVSKYGYTKFGKFFVFLDNGQVWRQIDGDADQAHFRRVAANNKVTIERGLIGSYNMTINDSDRVFKVTRVK